MLLALTLASAAVHSSASARTTLCARVDGLEAEHLSVLKPPGPAAAGWTPPVLDANGGAGFLFAWRVAAQVSPTGCATSARHPAARNVTQLGAVLTLTALDRAALPPVICHATAATDRSLVCGGGAAWKLPATRWAAKLEVRLRAAGTAEGTAAATGWFVRGLPATGWGGAEWIGLRGANDTAIQFRSAVDVHALGFKQGSDVARAMLFVSGLGGYRASVNGRAVDPTSVRVSVTEWHNRTFYWADDVTNDAVTSADTGHGALVVALEVFKSWYGLSNNFYPKPYGARALKAVVVLTHTNGTDTYALPTIPGVEGAWRHGKGSLLFDDLHAGPVVDGRLATPAWEKSTSSPPDNARADPGSRLAGDEAGWAVTAAVPGPPGELRAHPMQHSRVLEVLTPANVSAVPRNADNESTGLTYVRCAAMYCELTRN
jgi:hypothetical protein